MAWAIFVNGLFYLDQLWSVVSIINFFWGKKLHDFQAYNFELKLEWIWGKRYIAMKKQLSISNYKFIVISPAFWQHKMIVSVPVRSM